MSYDRPPAGPVFLLQEDAWIHGMKPDTNSPLELPSPMGEIRMWIRLYSSIPWCSEPGTVNSLSPLFFQLEVGIEDRLKHA